MRAWVMTGSMSEGSAAYLTFVTLPAPDSFLPGQEVWWKSSPGVLVRLVCVELPVEPPVPASVLSVSGEQWEEVKTRAYAVPSEVATWRFMTSDGRDPLDLSSEIERVSLKKAELEEERLRLAISTLFQLSTSRLTWENLTDYEVRVLRDLAERVRIPVEWVDAETHGSQ